MIPYATDGLVPTGTPFKIEFETWEPLDVHVETSGEHCVVRKKFGQRSKLAVGDIIISVNGIAFDKIAKIEEKVRAWKHQLFQEYGERILVVFRSDTATNAGDAPLEIRRKSTAHQSEAGLAEGYPHECPATNTSKTRKVRWKDKHLLQEAASLWTDGEGKRQTSEFLEAIKSCLLNDISPFEIATHVGNVSNKEGRNDQAVEFKRAQECCKRIRKSMQKKHENMINRRLSAVALTWKAGKAGKACPQTSECKAAIRECIIAGIGTDLLASHVVKVKQFNEEDQAKEFKRVIGCAKRIDINIATEKGAEESKRPIRSILKQPRRKEQVPSVEFGERKLVCKLSFEFDKE